MSTKTEELNGLTYTQLDSTLDSALDMQNLSDHLVKVVFAATVPALAELAAYKVYPNKGVSRDGKTGLMWGLVIDGATATVVVGE